MAYIQVPKQTMIDLGDSLVRIKSRLESEKKDGTLVHGLDDRHGDPRIVDAENGFQGAWTTSIEKLLEGIGGLGEVSQAIGTGAQTIDREVASAAGKIAANVSGFNFHI
ncbi:hypothetical protein [Gordonia sp. NPDC003585]|uniref:hypothetical protein n=1 Tax=Gordonia sp. NPDC003585 TaxID=3154275 RepID=UPI0033AA630C